MEKKPCRARRVHHRHLAAEDRVALVGEELAHHVDEAVAARDQDALLAVGREAHVGRIERQRLADADRLLAEALHVERQLLLPLRGQHAPVEDARRQHRAQAGQQQVGIGARIPWAGRMAGVVEHADERVGDVAGFRRPRVDRRPPHRAGGREVQVGEVGLAPGPPGRFGHVQAEGRVVAHR